MQKKFFAHSMGITMIFYTFATPYPFAVIAQLVEHRLPKPRVTGSSPAYRSLSFNLTRIGKGLTP